MKIKPVQDKDLPKEETESHDRMIKHQSIYVLSIFLSC